mmetsp:Transcript_10345/g.20857  ORF Transcript_10345/g.20857 Transcript_10345/m.20857 type:complete len:223 (-) Transcript_10345:72-740(-)
MSWPIFLVPRMQLDDDQRPGPCRETCHCRYLLGASPSPLLTRPTRTYCSLREIERHVVARGTYHPRLHHPRYSLPLPVCTLPYYPHLSPLPQTSPPCLAQIPAGGHTSSHFSQHPLHHYSSHPSCSRLHLPSPPPPCRPHLLPPQPSTEPDAPASLPAPSDQRTPQQPPNSSPSHSFSSPETQNTPSPPSQRTKFHLLPLPLSLKKYPFPIPIPLPLQKKIN